MHIFVQQYQFITYLFSLFYLSIYLVFYLFIMQYVMILFLTDSMFIINSHSNKIKNKIKCIISLF